MTFAQHKFACQCTCKGNAQTAWIVMKVSPVIKADGNGQQGILAYGLSHANVHAKIMLKLHES